jgi:hypothetical protein
MMMEDRIVPSGFFKWFPAPTPGPATHLEVIAPRNVKADQSFNVEVEALDANGRIATSYTGTVNLTLGSADGNATIPTSITFGSNNKGIDSFQATLTVSGTQTITATDSKTSSISGEAATYVNPAPTATSFYVEAPRYALAGGPITVTVVALDQYGHIATGYSGTVQITSNDGNASLPANGTFNSAADGRYTFQITYSTTGPETFVATDTKTSSITGQASVNVEAANSVTHFGVFEYGNAAVGVATSIVVVALDANNHVLAGYTGIVTFSSSSAVLPANYTFVAADDGRHTFSVTFNASGAQTITATDTVTSSITGMDDVWVMSNQHRFPWGWGFPW